ncbi:MAG TPA: type II toxin-antitoxin system VapC family toxin [Pyrinomonadaceae bacterium]|nr:type II toxin-antitoxin system VapC family toxin [Pyrinomonadaceae bacterium]
MIILDTDCLSLLNRESIVESSVLRQNLERFSPDDLFTTIITFEEQMRGWLAFVAKAKTLDQQIYAYEKLHRFLESYRNTTVLDFDENAAKVFQDLKAQKIRIGIMDLKIASIAIANQAILVSRNLKDFEQVPNLSVQDWTR